MEVQVFNSREERAGSGVSFGSQNIGGIKKTTAMQPSF